QIAAANSLSDIFAMGGRPLTALNIVGFPTDLVRPRVIAAILRGGLAKAAEVGCAIIGGHSIRNPEPIYGLAVTGVIDIRRLTTNANARPGDLLVLTKPLGTGIATTAIKRGAASRPLQKRVIALMSKVNTVGAELAELRLVRAATDVTGYGLMGHLISLCRASGASAEVDTSAVPMISDEIVDLIEQGCVPGGSRENLVATTVAVDWGKNDEPQRILLTDAQTTGEFLLSDEDCRKYGATARSRNLNRQSNNSIDRLKYFAPAGCNRSSTELGLQSIQTSAARRLPPRLSVLSPKSARAIPIWNTILQQAI